MALTEHLPVYRDVYRLILLVFDYTRHFSREYKYTLGQDMKRDAIVLVRSIYRANRSITLVVFYARQNQNEFCFCSCLTKTFVGQASVAGGVLRQF